MSNEVAVPAKIELTEAMLALIKKTIFRDATDEELALFKYICEKRQLDPFAKQIYARKQRQKNPKTQQYEDVMVIITAIDGFRLNAERSHKYVGQLGPFFTENGIDWVDCWLKSTPPKAAKVGVLRKDFREPVWATARFDAYCPRNDRNEPTGQWRTMPDGQIAKCAEALALRRAFPEELSGMYSTDEMHQAIDTTVAEPIGELTEADTPRARDADTTPQADFEADGEGAALPEPGMGHLEDTQAAPDGDYPTADQVKNAFILSPLPPAQKFAAIEKIVPDFQKRGGIDGLTPQHLKAVMEALKG